MPTIIAPYLYTFGRLPAPMPLSMMDAVTQFEKAKYKASETVRLSSENKMKTTSGQELVWWTEINEDFTKISKKNSGAYIGTAIPAYTLSIGTLVAFGLVLKHAEATKEKEDNEVA